MTRWEYEMNSELREWEKELLFGSGECEEPEELEYPHTLEISTEFQNVFEADVWDNLMDINHMLKNKNRKYGDSALNPARIFSKASNIEQLKVRLDDKLSRIKNAQDDEDEDVIADLIGYLVLLTIARESL